MLKWSTKSSLPLPIEDLRSSKMEEMQRTKRRRVYSFEPNSILLANFSHRYIAYLLPALIKVSSIRSCRGNNDNKIKKIVRFEIDMALVLSSTGFGWSRALKHKIDRQGRDVEKLLAIHTLSLLPATTCKNEYSIDQVLYELWKYPAISRPLLNVGSEIGPPRPRSDQNNKRRADQEELGFLVRTLRGILPGGGEMGVCELLSEVESYVVCLELQVTILRYLLQDQ